MGRKNKKEEQYEITVFGILTAYLNLSDKIADKIIDTLELTGRRKRYSQPTLILKGRDSELVNVEFKERNNGKKKKRRT